MQKLYFLKYSLISILLSVMFRAEAQSNDLYYRSAQNRLTNMLSGKESLNLREAIYCVENAWFNDKLNKKLFYKQIERYADFCRAVSNSVTKSANDGNEYVQNMLNNIDDFENMLLRNTVMGLFVNLSRCIEDNYSQKQCSLKIQTDRKLRKMIQKRKSGIGIREEQNMTN